MNIPGIGLICRSAMCTFYTHVRNFADLRKAPITAAIANLGKKKRKTDEGKRISKVKGMEVETDPNKLVNYVCGTDIFQGSEPIKIKPDSEYPKWLWSVQHVFYQQRRRESMRGTKEYFEKIKKTTLSKQIRFAKSRAVKV